LYNVSHPKDKQTAKEAGNPTDLPERQECCGLWHSQYPQMPLCLLGLISPSLAVSSQVSGTIEVTMADSPGLAFGAN